jgi:predicted ATPase
VADQTRVAFRDGVTVIPMGTLPRQCSHSGRADQSVCRTILAAIDRPPEFQPDKWPLASLEMLAVIDNAEHVLDAVTEVSQRLLRAFTGLRLIVTSRRTMAASSARIWEVEPLACHGDAKIPDAAELFVRRARSACPTLNLAGRLPEIGRLCAQLDGMPLAIELAARRLRSVSLDVLLQSDSVRQLLHQVNAADLPHQRTLADSVRWSYDLLTHDQRELLHRLAAFRGTFTSEEAERSCDQDQPASEGKVLGLLSELVDSSLVQVSRGTHYSYCLLGYVREFMAARCSPGDSQRRGLTS